MWNSREHGRWLLPLLFVTLTLLIAAWGSSGERGLPESGVRMIPVEGEGTQYWSRWRGPSGQGLVEGVGYPEVWSDQINVRWKTPVPGAGNSSPIVWKDRVFLTTAYDGGTRRSILAFERRSGTQLWETFAPEASPERAYKKNGYASATVATDGEFVYAYLGANGLLAVDFQGREMWHRGVGDVTSAFHGTAGSPLLYEDRVIIFQDLRGGDSFVAAFDKRSGRELWRTAREGRVGWGTPVAIRTPERDEIIISSNRRVQSYDPTTGTELWSCSGNNFEVIPTPVVGHGLVYCSSGRAGPTLAIRPGGTGDVSRTHLEWKAVKGSPFVPSPLLYGDYLYMVNDMVSIVTCYDAKTGKVIWQGRLGKAVREGFSASPVAFDGKIFLTNDEGQTFVIKAGPKFELLHVNELKERVLASPALVDGRWYFRTAGHLMEIGAE